MFIKVFSSKKKLKIKFYMSKKNNLDFFIAIDGWKIITINDILSNIIFNIELMMYHLPNKKNKNKV